jgi:ligand-binding SRPBCC domain-containing protein
MGRVEVVTYVATSPERCFDLARDVDLHMKSTAWTAERTVAGVTSGLLKMGDEVTGQARHLGIRWQMTVRISAYDRPRCFVDEMVAGPFRTFRHYHCFATEDTGTRAVDVLTYTVPIWGIGWLFDRLILQRYLRRFLRRRLDYLKAVAELSGTANEEESATHA